MATVTNTIGTSSRDYSTIALWEAALPANAVTAGNSYVGQCFNDSEFDLSTTQTVLAGTTTDSTHTITLTTGTGQGFRDNGSAASNALRYNASNGVAVKGSIGYDYPILVSDNWVTFSNIQFKTTATNASGAVKFGGTDWTVDSCIFQSVGSAGVSLGALTLTGDRGTAKDCLVVVDTSNAHNGIHISFNGSLINNTVVRPSDKTAGGNGIRCDYNSVTIQNCAIAGFGSNAVVKNSATASGSGNATDAAGFGTGPTGQTGFTIATEFENPSNASSVMDWRLKSTSVSCKDNGTNSGAPSTDIIGQAISNTTRDAGAWELQQGGGGGTFIAAWAANTNRPVIGTGTYAG